MIHNKLITHIVGLLVAALLLSWPAANAFTTPLEKRLCAAASRALSRHKLRESRNSEYAQLVANERKINPVHQKSATSNTIRSGIAASVFSAVVAAAASVAGAVSGGGLDYAGTDISGQEFSNGNYKGKDFTQVIAKGTNFAKSNLQGCRFYKAFLVNTDFSGADLRGASLEDTSLDGASLRDTIAAGTYFSASLLDVKDMHNADFTDAQIPVKTQALICQRDDVEGTNPKTGADTRESLFCP